MSDDGMSYDDSLGAFGHADDDAHQAIDDYYNGLINNVLYNGAHAAVAALQNGDDGSGAWMGGGSNNATMSPFAGGQDGQFQSAIWNGGSSPALPTALNTSSDMLANGGVPMGPSTNALAPGSNQPNGSYFNLFGADNNGNAPSFGLDIGNPAPSPLANPPLASAGRVPVGNQPDGALYQPFSSTGSNPQNQTIGGILSTSPTSGAENGGSYPDFGFSEQGSPGVYTQVSAPSLALTSASNMIPAKDSDFGNADNYGSYSPPPISAKPAPRDQAYGYQASDALNAELNKQQILGTVYPDFKTALGVWADAAQPFQKQYGTELISNIYSVPGGWQIGNASSNGSRCSGGSCVRRRSNLAVCQEGCIWVIFTPILPILVGWITRTSWPATGLTTVAIQVIQQVTMAAHT